MSVILAAPYGEIAVATLALIVLILAFVCELLAAFNVPAPPRVNLVALGLAFYFLTLIPGLIR